MAWMAGSPSKVTGSERLTASPRLIVPTRPGRRRRERPCPRRNPEAGSSRGLEAWGGAADRRAVGSVKQLAAAWTDLAAELDRQWIVWLDGRHLPQDVTLSPEAAGFVLPR